MLVWVVLWENLNGGVYFNDICICMSDISWLGWLPFEEQWLKNSRLSFFIGFLKGHRIKARRRGYISEIPRLDTGKRHWEDASVDKVLCRKHGNWTGVEIPSSRVKNKTGIVADYPAALGRQRKEIPGLNMVARLATNGKLSVQWETLPHK